MEVNTVVISLDRLKELERAEEKSKLPRSNTIIIKREYGGYFRVETDDECHKELALGINSYENKIKQLEEEMKITIEDVKRMNYWDFCVWRRK